MKVLIVSTTALPISPRYGGVEKLAYDYAEELAIQGHEVSLAAPQQSVSPEGVRLIETIKLPERQDWDSGAFHIYRSLLDEFDVIDDLSHNLYLGRTEPERPVINRVWDPQTQKYKRPPRNILALSQWQAIRFTNLYQQRCRFEDLVCVDLARYKPKRKRGDRWLFVGKMSADKGALAAIDICRELGEPIDVVGGRMPTDSPDYQHRVMQQHDPPDTIYYGNVSDEVKIGLMQRARGILHFAEEAHWLGGVEAFACGTPAVSMNVGAIKEVMDGSCGFIAHWKGEMLEMMKRIDEVNRSDCRAYARKRFDRRKVVRNLVKEIYGLVANGGSW